MAPSGHGTRQRLIVGLGTTIFSVALILTSHHPFIRPIFFAVIFLAIFGGFIEFEKMCQMKGFKVEKKAPLVLSFLYLIVLTLFENKTTASLFPVGFMFLSLFTLFMLQFRRGTTPIATLSTSLFGLLYIALPIATLYQINYLYPDIGPLWLLYLIIVVKLSDTVAFFVGSRLGKRPLAPVISPKKTLEGAFGGIIGSVVGSLAFLFFSPLPLNFFSALFLGALLGVLAELGDLSESLLKREVALKDSNHLPGLGGILDILDSLLFATPALFIYLLL